MTDFRFPILGFFWPTNPTQVLHLGNSDFANGDYTSFNPFSFVCSKQKSRVPVNRNHGPAMSGWDATWYSTEAGIFGYIDIEEFPDDLLNNAMHVLRDIRGGRLSAVSIESTTIASYNNGPVTVVSESLLTGIALLEQPANSKAVLFEHGNTYPAPSEARNRIAADYVPETVLQAFWKAFHGFNKQLKPDNRHDFYNPTAAISTVFRP